jgi:hypothetical protein
LTDDHIAPKQWRFLTDAEVARFFARIKNEAARNRNRAAPVREQDKFTVQ